MVVLIPGAVLSIMPGMGHFGPFGQLEEFNHIVLGFLQA